MKAFVDASLALAGDQANLPKACLDQVVGSVPAWASGSVRASDDALVFETIAPTTGESASTTKGSASAIASHLPPTTLAAIEIRDLGPRLVDGVDALKKALACDPATAAAIDQVEQALAAVGGVEALLGWADDTAVAVEFNGGAFGGGLAATTSDEAAASRTLDQLQALLALGGSSAGVTVRTEAFGDGELLILTVPSGRSRHGGARDRDHGPGWRLRPRDRRLREGRGPDVRPARPSPSSTRTSGRSRPPAATGSATSSSTSRPSAVAVETMIPAADKAQYETEIKPFLEPFEAFASVAEAPASTAVSRAVITFTK